MPDTAAAALADTTEATEAAVPSAVSAWDALRDALCDARPVPGESVPLFAWESPEGESFAAIGVADEWRGAVGTAFGEARTGVARLLVGAGPERARSRGGSGAPRALPVAFGGFPFAGDADPLAGFGAARFFVPLRTWHVSPEGRASEWAAPRPGSPGDSEPRATVAAPPDPHSRSAAAGTGRAPGGSLDHESWVKAVCATLEYIRVGGAEKVVLARPFDLESSHPLDPVRIFEALRSGQPGTYRFLLRDAAGHAFVGASPERLVRLVGGAAHSEAVAGTIRRGGNAVEDARLGASLLASDKDRREHAAVAREMQDALAMLCERVEADLEPHLLGLRHLLHLRTLIRAVPRPGTHVLELLERLHPTPAVAGVPRAAALDWIRRMEPCPRGWYSGPVGWVNSAGEGDFAVGIRSATLYGRRARVLAGAGIVAGSDPEAEWLETELKMRSMRDVLADV
jgi:menaquinone-specific isochorismate synthase